MGRKANADGQDRSIDCRKCRAACPATFKFCDQCGQKLAKATKAPKSKDAKRKAPERAVADPIGNAPETSLSSPHTTQAWFWGSQALPSISPKVPTKPHHEAESSENQREDHNATIPPLHAKRRHSHKRPRDATALPVLSHPLGSGDGRSAPKVPLSTPQVSLVWGQTLEKATAELKAKEAMLAAEIAANAQILAHMEAQAQAHAFQNDDVFKFACKTKRDLERAIVQDKAALKDVRDKLSQLVRTDSAVTTTKQQIQRIIADEDDARARRATAARRIQFWFRRQRKRRLTQSRLRMKVCRGYLRYRYVKRAHDIFPGEFFYVYDRKIKATQPHLEFVGDSTSGEYRLPYPVHLSGHPLERLGAAATLIQRWLRRIKAKWRRVLESVQRLVLEKARAVASQRRAAATKLQGLFRSRQAKRRLQLLVSSTYEECVDPATNMVFYYNTKTQESQWTRPRLWKRAAASTTESAPPPPRQPSSLCDLDTPRRVQVSAVKIQGLFRKNQATKKLKQLVAQTYQKVLDPETKQCYYYNAKTNTSQWTKPTLLGTSDIPVAPSTAVQTPRPAKMKESVLAGLLTPRRMEVAAAKIQGLYRIRMARRRLRVLVAQTYQKVFDAKANMCYYYNAKTGESHWTKPALLGAVDIPAAVPAALVDSSPTVSAPPRTTIPANPPTDFSAMPTPRRVDVAATKIQALFRARNARRRLRHLITQTYQKVLDADSQQYYYYNTKTGESQWIKPVLLGSSEMDTMTPAPHNTPRPRAKQLTDPLTALKTPRRVEVAATKIQGMYRTRNARRRLRHLIAQTYQKVLDADSQQYYYYNTKTGESQWVKPVLLGTSDLADRAQSLPSSSTPRKKGDPKAYLLGLSTPRQRDAAATKLQGLFRARLARRRLVALIASTYHKYVDADSQTCYYYNVKTGESSWVKPALLRSEDLSPQA